MDLRDRRIQFRLLDVYLPDPTKLLQQLYGTVVLEGLVVDLSNGGPKEDAFVVVSVEGVGEHVVVAVDRIMGVV